MPFKDHETRRARQKIYSRRYYEKNREQTKLESSRRRARIVKEWVEYRTKQRCARCGFAHPAVIEFHHVDRRNKRSVNDLVMKYQDLRAAVHEAETKCIPLCSNCHRILHWQERRDLKRKRKKLHGPRTV